MDDVTVSWVQEQTAPFDDPEFYPQGTVAVLRCGRRTVEVSSEGDRYLEHGDEDPLRNADQFRARFPDGKTPSDGGPWRWLNNGWFAVIVDGDYDGEEVTYSLAEALETARRSFD